MNTDAVPIWLLLLIALAALAYAGASYVRYREKRERLQSQMVQRNQNAAKYKAWRWLFGDPKPLRLSDQRPKTPPQD